MKIGLPITLPFEDFENPYVSPELTTHSLDKTGVALWRTGDHICFVCPFTGTPNGFPH